ncbi:hypothetical protein LguiA_018160 [Lonicera macranthoides]
MATVIGWYGPLIDLSKAASHIGDYVQLLVFVHKSTPIQYKLLKGGEVIRTDIQVGDDSRPFFSVSIWQKQMGSTIVAGNIILLQNVMVTRFGDVVEARTVQRSSLQCLVHPYESIFSKGAESLIEDCRVGITTKQKLQKVVEWVQRAGPTLHNVELQSYQVLSFTLYVSSLMSSCWSWAIRRKGTEPTRILATQRGAAMTTCWWCNNKTKCSHKRASGEAAAAIDPTNEDQIESPAGKALCNKSETPCCGRRGGLRRRLERMLEVLNRRPSINWKVHEETQSQDCFSLSDLLHLTVSCKATFCASVAEIFLPITWKTLHESEEEHMFIRRRLCIVGDNNLANDLICTGCQLCGATLNSELGSSIKQDNVPLYCQKSVKRLHVVSLIYRPFMLYVWDASNYIPILVTNKAAENLFANITAENVYSCYKRQIHGQVSDTKIASKEVNEQCDPKKMNMYLIWLILLKSLLKQGGKNSPLKFKVRVNPARDRESGRFELVSMSIPCN